MLYCATSGFAVGLTEVSYGTYVDVAQPSNAAIRALVHERSARRKRVKVWDTLSYHDVSKPLFMDQVNGSCQVRLSFFRRGAGGSNAHLADAYRSSFYRCP